MFVATIFLALGLMLAVYVYFNTGKLLTIESSSMASDVLLDNLKDPLITSRAYFTEPTTGPIGDFVGYSPMSQDDWLHSFSHEESKDKRSKYDKIRSLV